MRNFKYLFILLIIISSCNSSYKDLSDNDFKKVIEYIDFLKKNPN